MLEFIDTHAHLDDPRLEDTDKVLEMAEKAGVTAIIAPATNSASALQLQKLAARFKNVFFSAGVHCHEGANYSGKDLSLTRQLLSDPKAVAIGEVGLDYHYDFTEKTRQMEILSDFANLAAETGKPLILHCRDAEEDLYNLLSPFRGRIKGVVHCFTGSEQWAEKFIGLGFYIGFTGFITFKKSEHTREIAGKIPLNRILAETDAPYMAPVPHRGKTNSPALLPLVAESIAEARGISIKETADALMQNTLNLFGIDTGLLQKPEE